MKGFTRRFFAGREEDFWVRLVLLCLITAGVFILFFIILLPWIRDADTP